MAGQNKSKIFAYKMQQSGCLKQKKMETRECKYCTESAHKYMLNPITFQKKETSTYLNPLKWCDHSRPGRGHRVKTAEREVRLLDGKIWSSHMKGSVLAGEGALSNSASYYYRRRLNRSRKNTQTVFSQQQEWHARIQTQRDQWDICGKPIWKKSPLGWTSCSDDNTV